MARRCPTCQQPVAHSHLRVCTLCGDQIARHDKWFFTEDGKLRHRHCKYPTSYLTPREYVKAYGEEEARRMGVL